MEQHKSEGHMLFCLGMEPLVTHSHTHYQLHFVLFKLKHLVAKQHPISVYPPATVSDCLMDPAVYSKLQSVWCITWLWSEGFMPWVGGLEDTREFSHTRHTFTPFREHMRRKLLRYRYTLYSFCSCRCEKHKKGICKISTIKRQNIFNAKFNVQVIFNAKDPEPQYDVIALFPGSLR